MTSWLIPLFAIVVVAATDVWVYLDAPRCAAAGSPVYLRIGGFAIDTPAAWLVGCVILWIVLFPMYVMRRSRV